VAIAPEAPAAKARVEGRWLYVQALTKGRTTYTVTLRAGLKDEHGQTLGKDEKITFDVGPAEPRLFGAEGDMIVLEPASPRSYPVYSVNETALRTRLYAVTPDQWPAYVAYLRDVNDPRKNAVPPGKLVRDEELKPRGPEDTLATTDVDLKGALSKTGLGHVLLVVDGKKSRESIHLWVQSTKMAMSAFVDPEGVTGWVTRLADGGPVQNARIELTGVGTTTTDAQGLGSLVFGAAKGTLLFAKKDDDTVLLADRWRGELGLRRAERSDLVRWLVYDDRGMYKPGEEVHLKGWVRRGVMGKGGDTDRVPSPKGPVRWRVSDPRGAELAKGAASLDDQDGFDFAFALPKNANLGAAQVELKLESTSLQGAVTSHAVPVQEFRRPEFEVDVRASDEKHVVGTHAVVTASAAYYGGGALPNAKVEWHVTRSRGSYTPPNRGDWHFEPDDLGFW